MGSVIFGIMPRLCKTRLGLKLVYVFGSLFSTLVTASDMITRTEKLKIERFAEDIMTCSNMPGLSFGLIRGNDTYATGLGVASMGAANPVTKNTLFNLGSTAKAFVPYVLAEIMNSKENSDGRIRWNSTLKEMLPDKALELEASPWAYLRLKDMLAYQFGSSAADLGTVAGLPDGVSRDQLTRRVLSFLPHYDMSLRSSHHFSNIMYTLAAHIAEKATQMDWRQLVKVRVLDKQDMNTSSFTPDGLQSEDAALAYLWPSNENEQLQDKKLFDLHPFEPVGSLMVSAVDITKWLRHLLHNLNVKEDNSGINMLIADAFFQEVTLPNKEDDGFLRHNSEISMGYGMGWQRSKYRDHKRFRHGGKLFAYQSQIWLFPEKKIGVYFATNGPGTKDSQRAVDVIMYAISDILLGLEPWVDISFVCDEADKEKDGDDYYYDDGDGTASVKAAPLQHRMVNYLDTLDNYEGVYGNGYLGNARVFRNDAGILELKISEHLQGELIPGDTKQSMRFQVKGPLENTEEWNKEKDVVFERETGEFYSVVKFQLDKVDYVFKRDSNFSEMLEARVQELLLAKEEEEELMAAVEDEENLVRFQQDKTVLGNIPGKHTGENLALNDDTVVSSNEEFQALTNEKKEQKSGKPYKVMVKDSDIDEEESNRHKASRKRDGNVASSLHNLKLFSLILPIFSIVYHVLTIAC